MHKQINQTLRKLMYGESNMQTETPRFFVETLVVKDLALVILKL